MFMPVDMEKGCLTLLFEERILMKVLVWNEYRHEKENLIVANIYPQGIHSVIAEFLREAGFGVSTATLDEPEHGLTEEALAETDVLIWWGHRAHEEVEDQIVERVKSTCISRNGFACPSFRSFFKGI